MPGKDFVSTNKNLNGSLFHAVESLVPTSSEKEAKEKLLLTRAKPFDMPEQKKKRATRDLLTTELANPFIAFIATNIGK